MDYKVRFAIYDYYHRPFHQHNSLQINLYYDGKGFFVLKNKRIPVEKGDILIVPSNTPHFSMSKNGLRCMSILGDFMNLFNQKTTTIVHDNKNCMLSFSNLMMNLRNGKSLAINSLCNALAFYVYDLISEKKGQEYFVGKIISKIMLNYFDQSFKPSSLLVESGYSEDYARALFKKHTGKTPNEYLCEIRISHAKELISSKTTHESLIEIADKCGFFDYAYFSKKFKKSTGLSPIEYKKSLKKS